MGGSESHSVRVEGKDKSGIPYRDVNKIPNHDIYVTDAALREMQEAQIVKSSSSSGEASEQHEAPSPIVDKAELNTSSTGNYAKYEELEKDYKQRIHQLEMQNQRLYRDRKKDFIKAVEDAEAKFITHMGSSTQLCQTQLENILRCNRENPGKELNCVNIYLAYSNCVNDARQRLLVKPLKSNES